MNWLEKLKGSHKQPGGQVSKVSKPPLGTLDTSCVGGFQAATEHDEAIHEHLEERAAIQEYDGGLTRKQAETEALRTLRVFQYRLTDTPDSWLVLIAPGCDLDEARESLRARFGTRLLDTRKHSHAI